MNLRVVIADDEPLARDLLEAILSESHGVELVASCATGQEAVEAMLSHRPDLVFLDIEMPEMTGLEVAMTLMEEIPIADVPQIIFVTAYDRYAVQAFKVNAIDYVLKPVEDDDIKKSLDRVRHVLNRGDGEETTRNLKVTTVQSLIRLQDGEKMVLAPLESLLRVQAQGDYAMLYFEGRTRLIRSTLKAVEARLPKAVFKRVHRSSIINLKAVRELSPAPRGAATVILSDGSELTVSRPYKSSLQERLRN